MRSARAILLPLPIGRRFVARLLAVALVAAGFVFQGLLPGLDLALKGGTLLVTLAARTGICHAPNAGGTERRAVPSPMGDEGQSENDGCCLVCQAASQAKGALPSPTFTVPTAGTAGLRIAATASSRIDGQASRHHFARGPPAIAA
ncbi:hypothetical protein CCC_02860 [Paramagnetospirillum magnetotacticum MS-1]|uniref:DUF2946 domain-containing protein n=1 Tax=Paramagnetospirillum magnetotacticum MS-1 TaxID=272627 RepID=A0A0C2V4R7_PARME|nr:hypothetical protein [Paramagnetospirillum magnetotacticum]KIM00072.1 hypothetical protein CCC_02860 [Paramagnetospirillum magnetotacticum MS-1]